MKKAILLTLTSALCSGLLACSTTKQVQGDASLHVSPEAKALYPTLSIKGLESFCESSSSEDLVGCYVSESCSSDGISSQLLVSSFSKDGQLRSKVLFFDHQANCSASFTESSLSELDLVYHASRHINDSGVEEHAINSEHHFDAGSLGIFTTEYISIYHLENNRLCFPAADYSWGESGGRLSFSTESDLERPTQLNFSECMVRLNN